MSCVFVFFGGAGAFLVLVLFEGGSVKKGKNNSFVIKLLEIDWAV